MFDQRSSAVLEQRPALLKRLIALLVPLHELADLTDVEAGLLQAVDDFEGLEILVREHSSSPGTSGKLWQ
nr:hypothetical protein [Kocuria sp. cx-455]